MGSAIPKRPPSVILRVAADVRTAGIASAAMPIAEPARNFRLAIVIERTPCYCQYIDGRICSLLGKNNQRRVFDLCRGLASGNAASGRWTRRPDDPSPPCNIRPDLPCGLAPAA